MNATLITNGVNMEFKDSELLFGVLRILNGTGRGLPIQAYADVMEESQINTDKIEAHF